MSEQLLNDAERVPGSFGCPIPNLISRVKRGDGYYTRKIEQARSSVCKVYPWEHAVCAGDMTSTKALFDYDLFLKDEEPMVVAMAKYNPRAVSDEGFVPSMLLNGKAHAQQKAAQLALLPWWMDRVERFMEETLKKHFDSWIDSEERDLKILLGQLAGDYLGLIVSGVPIDSSQLTPWLSGLFYFIKPCGWRRTEEASVHARDKFISDFKSSPDMPEMASILKDIYSDDPDKLATALLFPIVFNGLAAVQGHLLNDIVHMELYGAEVKERLRKEVDEAVKKTDGVLTRETMNYIVDAEHLFYEVMRFFPVPGSYVVAPKEETVVESSEGRKFRVPAGLKCYGRYELAARDEKAFSEPQKFNIDRYKDEAEKNNLIFFGGPYKWEPAPNDHMCPAKDLAILTQKWVIAHLVLNYDIELAEAPTYEKVATKPVPEPDRPVMLKTFKKRDRS